MDGGIERLGVVNEGAEREAYCLSYADGFRARFEEGAGFGDDGADGGRWKGGVHLSECARAMVDVGFMKNGTGVLC